jgi:diphthine-ammonia ligase
MMMNGNLSRRSVLHVQSVSRWAPVCIGPYSQANVLDSALVYLAGQLGFVPASMTLATASAPATLADEFDAELDRAVWNCAQVVGVSPLNASMTSLLMGTLYFSAHRAADQLELLRARMCTRVLQLLSAQGNLPGAAVWNQRADQSAVPRLAFTCPLVVVTVPSLPKNAAVELELSALSKPVYDSFLPLVPVVRSLADVLATADKATRHVQRWQWSSAIFDLPAYAHCLLRRSASGDAACTSGR